MVKKYLLTFSLAAISCLATKSIHNIIVKKDSIQQVEIANNKSSLSESHAQVTYDSHLKMN